MDKRGAIPTWMKKRTQIARIDTNKEFRKKHRQQTTAGCRERKGYGIRVDLCSNFLWQVWTLQISDVLWVQHMAEHHFPQDYNGHCNLL